MKIKTAHIWCAMSLTLVLAARQPASAQQLHGQELRHDDPEVREYLDKNVPKSPTEPLPPTKEETAQLSGIMDKGDRYEIEQAAWVMGDWPSPNNIAPLLKACDSEQAEIRAQASASLGMQFKVIQAADRETAITRLKRMMDDKDPRVAQAALVALGLLKASSVSSKIGAFAGSQDKQLALAATRAIGGIGEAKNFDYLRKPLASADPDLTCAAMEATGKLGDARLAVHLVPKLESQSVSEQVAAIRAILSLKAANLAPDLKALLKHQRGPVRREALAALVELAGAECEQQYLAHTEDPDYSVRRVAAQAIGRFRFDSGIPHLFTLFADEHFYVREDAVDSMVAIGNEKAIQTTAAGLSSKTDTVRECVSQTLGRLKSDASLEAHIKLLGDKYLLARTWAAWALGEIGRQEANKPLFDCAFAPKQDVEAATCAIFSMGKLRYAEKPVIDKYRWMIPQKPVPGFEGQPTPMRLACVRALGMVKDEGSLDILSGRLSDMYGMFPEAPDLRRECAVAMGRIGSKRALGILRQHMGQGEEMDDIRVASQWALWQITGEKPELKLPPKVHPAPDYFVRYLKPKEKSEPAEKEAPKAPEKEKPKPAEKDKPKPAGKEKK